MQGTNANRQAPVGDSRTSREKPEETAVKAPAKELSHSNVPCESNDPLGGLFKDKEKLLVLLLVMLLSEESSNTELVLALLYIII